MVPPHSAATGRETGQASRKADILDLAAGLFALQGVDKTTVREIGAAAGILSGSLYHYFDSKESISSPFIGRDIGPSCAVPCSSAGGAVLEPLPSTWTFTPAW